MATIKTLVERIETRLFLASGLDVQTHAEDQIVEMIRNKYNLLFDDHFYTDYTYPLTTPLDGTTGQVTIDLSAKILRYVDIHSVLPDTDDTPLPRLPIGSNPARVQMSTIAPSQDKTKVFQVWPNDETFDVTIWYRTRLSNDVWDKAEYETEVPMDDEMLIIGCVWEFLVMDASNSIAIQEYKKMFDARVVQVRKFEANLPISKGKVERDGPLTRWS